MKRINMATMQHFFFFQHVTPALHPALLNPPIPRPRRCPPAYTFAPGTRHADAPSPRYMRKRVTWSGRVLRSEYLWAWRAGKRLA